MNDTHHSADEAARLAALERYRIMDTDREREYDDIVKVAAQICGTPMALISLVDDTRQWFKAAVGLSAPQTPRGIAFCAHAIEQSGVFLVEDASQDPRFKKNPLVTKDPNLRFYAGAPLETPDGHTLGTLCVLDSAPRTLDKQQQEALQALSRQVMALLELRRFNHAQHLEQEKRAGLLEQEIEARAGERNRLWSSTNDLMGTIGLDGYLKEINPAWSRLLGWSDQEILSRPYVEFVLKADRERALNTIRSIAKGELVPDHSLDLIAKDGTAHSLIWSAVRNGNAFYVVGRDVTAQQRAEERLRQSQKMDAVGQLTGGIAHDFNNLLAGIMGSLELLEVRVKQGQYDTLSRYLETAKNAGKRAASLTHRLLAFSRQQTLAPQAVNINRLVAGMEELIRRSVGPSIQLEVVGVSGIWPALIDPNQLENALLNLCINARDAMPNGGKVTIETANKWIDEHGGKERDIAPGQYISVCVTDTGTGMTPEVIARAFDPFYTTKPLGTGTGLGLSMVYGFARQSGGQVRIYSEVGRGTTMCIYLPRHRGEMEDFKVEESLEQSLRFEHVETILVVDDEPSVRMFVTEVLTDAGYHFIEAADGATALQLVRSTARIDLLITDVGLPGGLNGRQLAEAAREANHKLKVLFITGYAENAVVGHGHLEHGMHLLTKPFTIQALHEKVDLLLSRTLP